MARYADKVEKNASHDKGLFEEYRRLYEIMESEQAQARLGQEKLVTVIAERHENRHDLLAELMILDIACKLGMTRIGLELDDAKYRELAGLPKIYKELKKKTVEKDFSYRPFAGFVKNPATSAFCFRALDIPLISKVATQFSENILYSYLFLSSLPNVEFSCIDPKMALGVPFIADPSRMAKFPDQFKRVNETREEAMVREILSRETHISLVGIEHAPGILERLEKSAGVRPLVFQTLSEKMFGKYEHEYRPEATAQWNKCRPTHLDRSLPISIPECFAKLLEVSLAHDRATGCVNPVKASVRETMLGFAKKKAGIGEAIQAER